MKYKRAQEGTPVIKKDYAKKIIFGLSDFGEPGHLLQTVTIPPQTKQRVHVHAKQTEVYYILSGETVININGTDYTAKPGDAFITEPGDKHFLWNKTNAEFTLVVFKINLPTDSDDTIWEGE